MKTLIIKTPRRLARDAREQFADAEEFFDGGVDTLASWLGANVGDDDLASLMEDIRIILHRRVQEQVTGAVDSRRQLDIGGALAKADYETRFPNANRLK
jgi:hypothetical protein